MVAGALTGSCPQLYLFYLQVGVETSPGKSAIVDYWVRAKKQCAAVKWTMFRDEVVDIVLVKSWEGDLPDGVEVTFTTLQDCP